MAEIVINNIRFDPKINSPEIAAVLAHADSARSNYILVQGRTSLSEQEQSQLQAAGATILEYVPEQTYLCRFTASDLNSIRRLPFVSWADFYMKELKVKPALSRGIMGLVNMQQMTAGPPRTGSVIVDAVVHEAVDPASLRQQAASATGVDPSAIVLGRRKLRLTIDLARVPALAAIDGIHHVEQYVPPQPWNAVARRILNVEQQRSTTPLLGTNQIIAISDTGLDTGDPANIHPAFQGRVLKIYALGGPGRPIGDDPKGHGTHVAGSALGNGTSQSLGKVQGTAPGAKIVFQSLTDAAGEYKFPPDLQDLLRPPFHDDGARIYNISWGADTHGDYNAECQEADDFVWNNRELLICKAAGNAGTDAAHAGSVSLGSIDSPGAAKNVLTVGATENFRPNFCYGGVSPAQRYGDLWPSKFPIEPLKSGKVANSPAGISPISSRGPAGVNRIKPDVVAPGIAILSTKSSKCPVPTSEDWGSSSDPQYIYKGGTSMATPLVAGCAAVLREWLATSYGSTLHGPPPASLMKALLINLAVPVKGQFDPPETKRTPDMSQGFGRVSLDSLWGDVAFQPLVISDEDAALNATGDSKIWSVPDFPSVLGGFTVTVTLVWTDPPGEGLQNDLDLVVDAFDATPKIIETRHGNLEPGRLDFDRENNVEQVWWPNFTGKSIAIVINAHRILPGKAQNYSLVVRVEPTFPKVSKIPFITAIDNTALVAREDGTVDNWSGVNDIMALAGMDGQGLALCGGGRVVSRGFDQAYYAPKPRSPNASSVHIVTRSPFLINMDGTIDHSSPALLFHGASIGWPGTDLWPNVLQAVSWEQGCILLKKDGLVEAWQWPLKQGQGWSPYQKIDISPQLNNFVRIASLSYPYPSKWAGLRADGTAVAFSLDGINNDISYRKKLPYIPYPDGLVDVVQIATGYEHVVVLKRDGTVSSWGTNGSNQCNVPAGLQNVVSIAANKFRSFALKADGSVLTWGADTG